MNLLGGFMEQYLNWDHALNVISSTDFWIVWAVFFCVLIARAGFKRIPEEMLDKIITTYMIAAFCGAMWYFEPQYGFDMMWWIFVSFLACCGILMISFAAVYLVNNLGLPLLALFAANIYLFIPAEVLEEYFWPVIGTIFGIFVVVAGLFGSGSSEPNVDDNVDGGYIPPSGGVGVRDGEEKYY